MKWYKFYTIMAIAALAVYGGFALRMGAFRFSWLRPLMMVLEGFAILSSEYMILEEDCKGEMSW